MRFATRLAALAAFSLVLSACTQGTGRYPSLAKRDAERMVGSIPVPEPEPAPTNGPPPPAVPQDVAQQLDRIAAAAEAAHADFLEQVPRARARASAARGAGVASDSWADAQVALASLESARSDTMFALADLDGLLADRGVASFESSVPQGLERIISLREIVAGVVAEEDAVLAQLRGLVR